MNEHVEKKIAVVSGAPGRSGVWDGNKLSGMATRFFNDNIFLFPHNAHGLVTACSGNGGPEERQQWQPLDAPEGDPITQATINVSTPVFSDPACANPEDCKNKCIEWNNNFQYRDCLETEDLVDAAGNPFKSCKAWGMRYSCTEQPVNNPNGICEPNANPIGEFSNSRTCQGADCRCGRAGVKTYPSCKQINGHLYFSYYRNYTASYTRDPVPSDGPQDDTTRNDIPIGCYGNYNEFDPKYHQTQPPDRRCVMNVDVSNMYQSQMGKGEYGQNARVNDTDPIQPPNQRPQSSNPNAKDIWFTKLGWGFSLLKEDSFKNDFEQDLSKVFLNTDSLDQAKMTASWPIAKQNEQPRLAVSDTLRSFDDTGSGIVVSWWQKNQTEVATVLHPPVVRLLLPPGYAFGADPADPLFATVVSSTGSVDLNQKRSMSIELQLDAHDDIVGEALGYIERSFLLHIEEDPVPVLVPEGSPTEFRARAEEWCTWWMRKSGQNTCANAPQNVLDIIDKLNTYADQIENVRTLRVELAAYTGKVMTLQSQLTKPISDWMKQNLAAYKDYLQNQQALSTVVRDNWRQAQDAMTTFHDKTNLPWCMNQRYTMPVYPLLDTWLPSRSDNGKMTADGLPTLTIPRTKDLIIDFSGITYMTGSLKLPVLKPIVVRVNIPSPPSITDDATITTPLPDLPDISNMLSSMDSAMDTLPKVGTGSSYPPLALPQIDNLAISNAFATIQQIKQKINEMNDRYDKFWQSIGPLSAKDVQAQQNDPNSLLSRKQALKCDQWDNDVCQHVEMDLLEELQRIDSRKLVFLNEDYDSAGPRRTAPDSCMPRDQVCMLLHGEKAEPAYQWEVRAPKKMPDLGTDARATMRDLSLPRPIGGIDTAKFLPYDVNMNDLLPSFDVPKPINLTP